MCVLTSQRHREGPGCCVSSAPQQHRNSVCSQRCISGARFTGPCQVPGLRAHHLKARLCLRGGRRGCCRGPSLRAWHNPTRRSHRQRRHRHQLWTCVYHAAERSSKSHDGEHLLSTVTISGNEGTPPGCGISKVRTCRRPYQHHNRDGSLCACATIRLWPFKACRQLSGAQAALREQVADFIHS